MYHGGPEGLQVFLPATLISLIITFNQRGGTNQWTLRRKLVAWAAVVFEWNENHAPWLIRTVTAHLCGSFRGPPAKRQLAWLATEQHGTEWSNLGNLRIFTSNGGSHPGSEKRGGQLSSSTSIHYASIKKMIKTDWLTDIHIATQVNLAVVQKCTYCWTIKRYSVGFVKFVKSNLLYVWIIDFLHLLMHFFLICALEDQRFWRKIPNTQASQ